MVHLIFNNNSLMTKQGHLAGSGILLNKIIRNIPNIIKAEHGFGGGAIPTNMPPANRVGGIYNTETKNIIQPDRASPIGTFFPTGGSVLHTVKVKHNDYHKKPIETKKNNIRFVL